MYEELQKEGKLESLVRKVTKAPEAKKVLRTAEHEVKKKKGCNDEGATDCDEVAPGAGVDQNKLDFCMEQTDSDTVRANIRKAFEVGNLRTGCALLSLATNSVLKGIHDCMCGSGAGAGGGDNANAVGAVASQLAGGDAGAGSGAGAGGGSQGPSKVLTDVAVQRRFLRFRSTSETLRKQ